ncbi:beta-lactamase family protein [Streptomyces sp. ISL-90]|nr:beta-lactamase family protein [Streptomyces sp. ISL-90]
MTDLTDRIEGLVAAAIENGTEQGVQVAVYRHGELVLDIAAGLADAASRRPMTRDTLVYSASTGKAVASTVAHVLVERGAFGYDSRLVEVWPEFGAHGKESTTLRHLLTHSTGVPALPRDVSVEQLCDWEWMTAMLADAEPLWAPGERVGYHAGTFGHLLGEFVRRATGKTISQVLAEEIGAPLGIEDELRFGVPAAELQRVAVLENDPQGHAIFASLPDEFPLFAAAPRQVVPDADFGNRADVLTADLPYQGTLSARAIARMYAALLDDVDGVRLVAPARLAEMSTLATAGFIDEMTGGPSVWSLGYCVGWPGTSAAEDFPTMFGMVGIGGSGAHADRATGVSVAVTKNRFNPVDMSILQGVSELVTAEFAADRVVSS